MNLLDRIRNEPAVTVGVVVSIVTLIIQAVNGDVAWTAAIPAVGGVLTRFLVYGPATAAAAVDAATADRSGVGLVEQAIPVEAVDGEGSSTD